MKRIFATVLSLVLLFSISLNVFAQESNVPSEAHVISFTNGAISPRSVVTLKEFNDYMGGGNIPYSVTPAKGSNLKFVLGCYGDDITITVRKSSSIFTIKSYDIPGDGTVSTYDLVDNCNGGSYIVTFKTPANGYSHVVGALVQTDYV